MDKLMVYSTRPHGYMHGGVRYPAHPKAIRIVDEPPGETEAAAKQRRTSGKLSKREVNGIRALIGRADAAGVEPALRIVEAPTQLVVLEHEIEELRDRQAGIEALIAKARGDAATLEAANLAARERFAAVERAAAQAEDERAAAQRELQATEQELGTNKELAAKLKKAEAEIRKLKQKAQQG